MTQNIKIVKRHYLMEEARGRPTKKTDKKSGDERHVPYQIKGQGQT